MFYFRFMEQIDSYALAEALLRAPGWARVGLTAPTPNMREKAAQELAESVLERLRGYPGLDDPSQLRLL